MPEVEVEVDTQEFFIIEENFLQPVEHIIVEISGFRSVNMSKRYVTDAKLVTEEVITESMSHNLERGYIYYEFSNSVDFDALVTPSAGTVKPEASHNGVTYGDVADGSAVAVNTDNYTVQNFLGSIQNVRANPVDAIAGATHWRMVVARY